VLKRLAGRTPLIHIKDGPATTPEADMVAVGGGALNYPAILAQAQTDYVIVELDRCATDMLDALASSYRYLIDRGLAQS
jgi:sugar phosphate isomerase/epimerase